MKKLRRIYITTDPALVTNLEAHRARHGFYPSRQRLLMTPDLISKDELIAAGWKNRQFDAALDESDECGPSGHWANTWGKPY